MWGTYHSCSICSYSYELCFKCYLHKDKIHVAGHDFREKGGAVDSDDERRASEGGREGAIEPVGTGAETAKVEFGFETDTDSEGSDSDDSGW